MMGEEVPGWLANALPEARAGQGARSQLAIARLASAQLFGKNGFAVSSPAFADQMALDPCFTADEEDAVAPPLEWTRPPEGTHELTLVVEDPDMPGEEPFCHWLVWGLKPDAERILEGEAPPKAGKNAHGNSEWLLPEPPEGDGAHAYVFQLFALDRALDLAPGATREDLFAAMTGGVLAAALVSGVYTRAIKAWDEDEFAAED